jgi:hypothetical protein
VRRVSARPPPSGADSEVAKIEGDLGILRYPVSATAAEKPFPHKGQESFPSWTSPVRPRSPALSIGGMQITQRRRFFAVRVLSVKEGRGGPKATNSADEKALLQLDRGGPRRGFRAAENHGVGGSTPPLATR